MAIVSMLGFLFSHEDFTFKETHLKQIAELVHINFIVFMQTILNKLTPAMLAANFWARSLQQIVAQKIKYKQGRTFK